MADLKDIQNQLQALSDNYAAVLPTKLAEIRSLWDRAKTSNAHSDLDALIFICHKLAGSGASFGFAAISENARAVEIEIQALRTASPDTEPWLWDEETQNRIEALIDTLLKHSQPPETAPNPTLSISTAGKIPAAKKNHFSDNETMLIYIQEKNRLLVDDLTSKLVHYNYNVRVFSSLTELHQAILDTIPDVVIIGSTLFNSATKQMLREFKKDHRFTVIHLANNGDFTERLEAVRNGADYYFTKPVDFSSIIDTLDELSDKKTTLTSKALIVDDSISTSEFYSLSLKGVGIETKVVTDPFKVMDAIIDFKPELILLDLNMPKCSGLELAAVIRQQENFISIPIVFLSGETDAQKQLATLETGADEFLTKPINVNHLIAVVKNKIIRYRQLSAYMHNDSLTGLLNHTSILSALDTEISRAKRQKGNLSYVMLDIDFFKKINDTYGHHMGDIVLKNISRFLKQNLRITDLVGRYGGEEFVAILPGIGAEKAMAVMQKILDVFSKIEFVHFNHKFTVIFSCGIADYNTFGSAEEMIDAADKALYVAKDAGRHCIRLAISD